MSTLATLVYDGITSTAGWTFTFGLGISPSNAVIVMPPTVALNNAVANLVLTQEYNRLTFTDCRVARVVKAKTGRALVVTIQDRRWKWAFGKVDGYYNERKEVPGGTPEILHEKTPQELATLLLESMNETGYSVSGLPNGSRPAATWTAANPAQALQSLVSSLGCFVCLNPITNRVSIFAAGVGGGLPYQELLIQAASPISLAAQPDELRVITGPVLFQSEFELGEAVGMDTDGKIKKIDDLSYKPTNGWEKESNPEEPVNVTGTYVKDGKTLNKIDLAKDSIWKMYRVIGLKGSTEAVPLWSPESLKGGDYEPEGIDDITLLDRQILREEDPAGKLRRLEAVVVGVFASKDLNYENTKDGTQVPYKFEIDSEKGIVTFSDPVYKYDDTLNEPSSAELWLRTSFEVQKNGVKVRHEEWQPTVGTTYNAGPKLLRHPEIHREIVEADGTTAAKDNLTEVEEMAAYYIEAELTKLAARSTVDAVYARIHKVTPDGVNRQITWSGGGGRRASTQISQNQEHNSYVPTYETAQRIKETESATEGFEITDPEAKR